MHKAFLAALALVLAGAIIHAAYRVAKGKAIFARPPDGSTFVGRWSSGRSLDGLGVFGAYRGCLLIAAGPYGLFVRLQFPFSLGFVPGLLGVDGMVMRSQILAVEERNLVFWRSVIVTFVSAAGDRRRVELIPFDTDGLLAALRRSSASAPG